MTSHDVVNRVRKVLQLKHVGHGGTLDPLAAGVLPIAIGSACRLLRFLANDKIYLAEIYLGASTTTDDKEGEIIVRETKELKFTKAEIEQALSAFVGQFSQLPPAFSAVHHQGKRLYELARSGKIVEGVKRRPVLVHSIDFLDYAHPILTLRIACGAGTYIRSIARDLGEKLGTQAHLHALLREKSGPFAIQTAISLTGEVNRQDLYQHLIPPQRPLSMNQDCQLLEVSAAERKLLITGQRLRLSNNRLSEDDLASGKLILAVYNDALIALCKPAHAAEIAPEDPEGKQNLTSCLGEHWLLKAEVVISNAE